MEAVDERMSEPARLLIAEVAYRAHRTLSHIHFRYGPVQRLRFAPRESELANRLTKSKLLTKLTMRRDEVPELRDKRRQNYVAFGWQDCVAGPNCTGSRVRRM